MMIKTKKQLNLPQLIEWALKNEKFGNVFVSNNLNSVHVTDDGIIEFTGTFYGDTFTIITKEEITEDTRFEHMIEITEDDLHITWQNTKIDWEKDGESKEFHAYIDGEFKCIWRDGKLVD